MSALTVKDLVTLLIDSEGPVEKYAVIVVLDDGRYVTLEGEATIDHDLKALVLEKE